MVVVWGVIQFSQDDADARWCSMVSMGRRAFGPLGSVQIGLIERAEETFVCRILYECKFS